MKTEFREGPLAQLAETASAWLFGLSIPLWIEKGVDTKRGGFYDALDDRGENAAIFKRLRVTARQIYVFAQAAQLGFHGAEAVVKHGLSFLLGPLRNANGGYSSRTDLSGNVIDDTRDLYDLAFALFAFAHGYKVLRDEALRTEALKLAAFLYDRLSHPAGGFVEALPHRQPRRQNPHMHLLEAALACFEYFGDDTFRHLAEGLVDLCLTRFINRRDGVLYEYFQDDLTAPLRDQGRAITEPGHHFEWTWLFSEAARLLRTKAEDGRSIAEFAFRHGRDPATGILVGEVFDDGVIADKCVRLWPHAEWLKATLVIEHVGGSPNQAWNAMNLFLTSPTPGLWHETWDPAANAFASGPKPASTLYHITVAIMELRRHASAGLII